MRIVVDTFACMCKFSKFTRTACGLIYTSMADSETDCDTRAYCELQVGDRLPDINVYEKTPGNAVNVRELFAGKKGILFGVPGAFLPGCSLVGTQHLPSPLSLQNLNVGAT